MNKINLADYFSSSAFVMDFASIHVDEFTEWCPAARSTKSWIKESVYMFNIANSLKSQDLTLTVALSLRPTKKMLTEYKRISIDFSTPPSLYLTKDCLEFPPAWEQFYSIIPSKQFGFNSGGVLAIARSARDEIAFENGSAFDNVVYFTSKFFY